MAIGARYGINGSIDGLYELTRCQDVLFGDGVFSVLCRALCGQLLDAFGNILLRQVVAARVEADRSQNAQTLIDGARTRIERLEPSRRVVLLEARAASCF